MKVKKRPSALLYPPPACLVTSVDRDDHPNIITIGSCGSLCVRPPIIGISIVPRQYSHGLIAACGEFVVNVPTTGLLRLVDYCGTVSGRDVDKFRETGLTPVPADRVRPPLIEECPVNLECVLRERLDLGSHTLFLGEVVALHVDEDLLDEGGRIVNERADPIVVLLGEYWGLGGRLAPMGFSEGRL
ncbi:MAG: flavin reductase family protein [Candidatus Bathyarchaeia archaeon]